MALNEAQAVVLATLAPGGFLTVDQLSRDGQLTKYRARAAIASLRARGLVAAGLGLWAGRYQITARGRGLIVARERYYFPRPAAG